MPIAVLFVYSDRIAWKLVIDYASPHDMISILHLPAILYCFLGVFNLKDSAIRGEGAAGVVVLMRKKEGLDD